MPLVEEIPHQRIKIIGLLSEFNIQVIGEDIGHFIKTFQTTIFVYDGFGAPEIGAESQWAHGVGI
jgi:hypothetical protein